MIKHDRYNPYRARQSQTLTEPILFAMHKGLTKHWYDTLWRKLAQFVSGVT